MKPSATSTISLRINISLLSLTSNHRPHSDRRTLKKQVRRQMHKLSVPLLGTHSTAARSPNTESPVSGSCHCSCLVMPRTARWVNLQQENAGRAIPTREVEVASVIQKDVPIEISGPLDWNRSCPRSPGAVWNHACSSISERECRFGHCRCPHGPVEIPSGI
jgi:hypothetical protein